MVYIGKEQQPISLPEIVSVNSHSWKKAASFGTLMESVNSLKDSHTIADIMSIVSNEIPIDSSAAYQKAQYVSKLIVDSVLNPAFLNPLAFLTSAGKEAKILDPTDLKKRPVDITYVRFCCTINSSSVDARIVNISDLTFDFCLQ